jgi:hypothetical protein
VADSARPWRPLAESRSVLLNVRSLMAGQSTPVSLASIPNSGACRTWSATFAASIRILLGMQPRLRQVPPNGPDSISATGPWARWTTTLPEPEPMMTSEK